MGNPSRSNRASGIYPGLTFFFGGGRNPPPKVWIPYNILAKITFSLLFTIYFPYPPLPAPQRNEIPPIPRIVDGLQSVTCHVGSDSVTCHPTSAVYQWKSPQADAIPGTGRKWDAAGPRQWRCRRPTRGDIPGLSCSRRVQNLSPSNRTYTRVYIQTHLNCVYAGASIPMGQGGHVPPIFGPGGHDHECPPPIFLE